VANSTVVEIILKARNEASEALKQVGVAANNLRAQMSQLGVEIASGRNAWEQLTLPTFTSHVTKLGSSFKSVDNTMKQSVLPGYDALMRKTSGAMTQQDRAAQTNKMLGQAMRDMAARQTEAAEVATIMDGVYRALTLTFLAVGAAASKLALSAVMTAARTEELALITERMATTHGYGVQYVQQLEESIKELGITTQGARLILTQFMGSNIGLAKSTEMARAAQDLATLAMVDSSEAAADLAYTVASLQPRLLRKYRIYISLVDVYREAAQELNKTVVALTDYERQQAFVNAILEEAADYTDLYEQKMRTASGRVRSMPRYLQELRNELGEGLIPVLDGVALGFKDVTDLLRGLPDVVQTAIASLAAVAGVLTTITAATRMIVGASVFQAIALPFLKLAIPIAVLTGLLLVLRSRFQDVQEAMQDISIEGEKIRKEYIQKGQTYDSLLGKIEEVYNTELGLADKVVIFVYRRIRPMEASPSRNSRRVRKAQA